jgi:hypothetical protein
VVLHVSHVEYVMLFIPSDHHPVNQVRQFVVFKLCLMQNANNSIEMTMLDDRDINESSDDDE